MTRYALLVCVLLSVAPSARAGTFQVGIADPGVSAISSSDVSALGLTIERRSVLWLGSDRFTGALKWTPGLRHIVSVWGGYPVQFAPSTPESRSRYCSFVLSIPGATDVVIWNEPNLGGFWGLGASSYADLVASCAPRLHAAGLRVLAPGMSPATISGAADFARKIAARGPHLIDAWDQHEYDKWAGLAPKIDVIRQAFGWKIPVLVGESSPDLLPWAYCSGASGFLNFKLRDDGDWRLTGLRYANGAAKPAYARFARTVAQIRARTLNCGSLPPPKPRGERTAFRSRHKTRNALRLSLERARDD